MIDDYVNIEANCNEAEKRVETNPNVGDSLFILSKSMTSFNNKNRNSKASKASMNHSLESYVQKGKL